MYVGIDIGGSKMLIGLANTDGKLLKTVKLPTPLDGHSAEHILEYRIKEMLGDKKLKSIGIAAPGPMDFKHGVILSPPNMPWHNLPIVKQLHARFKVPVVLENDAGAAGLAESLEGAGKDSRYLLYITISTGIGTGLIAGGEIIHGASDPEGGHIVIDPKGPQCSCGGQGHFEGAVSGRAIERRFGRPAYQIKDAATWDIIARDMAAGLASLIAITAPDRVVLGGGVSVHYNRFKKPLAKHLEHFASRLYPLPPVVVAKRVEQAALDGALILARRAK